MKQKVRSVHVPRKQMQGNFKIQMIPLIDKHQASEVLLLMPDKN